MGGCRSLLCTVRLSHHRNSVGYKRGRWVLPQFLHAAGSANLPALLRELSRSVPYYPDGCASHSARPWATLSRASLALDVPLEYRDWYYRIVAGSPAAHRALLVPGG